MNILGALVTGIWNPDSLLAHYRGLVRLRNQHSALRTGKYAVVQASDPHVYAVLRLNGDEILLVLVNLGGQEISDYSLGVEQPDLGTHTYTTQTLFGGVPAQNLEAAGGVIEKYKPITSLPPYSTFIIKFQP